MKGGSGRKRNYGTDPAQPPPPDPESAGDGSVAAGEGRHNTEDDSGRIEGAVEDFEEEEGEDEEFSGADREYEQLGEAQIGEAAEGERTKLADGYYEIEAVRRKRVRKGKVQYLIKWRGWPEAANTWEPVGNLLQCSDIIDAFEESLKPGKSRCIRKRKRKASVTHVQTKKKQQDKQQHQQQRSPATATYSVPSHVIKIADEPMPFPRLKNFTSANESGQTTVYGLNSLEISKKANEIGARIVREEEKEQNQWNLKLSELKGAMVAGQEVSDRLARTSEEGQRPMGDDLANELRTEGLNPVQTGRFTGAKKRKSGCVKRFMKGPEACSIEDAANGVSPCGSLAPESVERTDFFGNNMGGWDSKYENNSKSMCAITQIVKPISYKASVANNVQDVLVAFEAVRSDGTKVIVDNKFLKAYNPLLLIDFYEKNLRYSPT
ncbi:Chromo domain-containing protein LHP1 [Striga hermonthica]|uniref:Chromo domain-containing protein LHP1 n=1 Tax=Striga hermonthica TaxID=68872 RepID=A0A9N7RAF8_STRHE|nr:Chromo domain-containing protein LHP1 [Striga hermonthica]